LHPVRTAVPGAELRRPTARDVGAGADVDEAALRERIRTDPKDIEALCVLGSSALRLGFPGRAIGLFRRALDAEPAISPGISGWERR